MRKPRGMPARHALRAFVAVAELADGSFVQRSVDVVVTLAACIEN